MGDEDALRPSGWPPRSRRRHMAPRSTSSKPPGRRASAISLMSRLCGADRRRRRCPPAAPFLDSHKANAEALAELQARGQLPIRHRWIRYVRPEPEFQAMRPMDEIAVGTVAAEVIERLASEVRARGFFDRRTWSVKRNLRTGNWWPNSCTRMAPLCCAPPRRARLSPAGIGSR